jgi:hypothetical protein
VIAELHELPCLHQEVVGKRMYCAVESDTLERSCKTEGEAAGRLPRRHTKIER